MNDSYYFDLCISTFGSSYIGDGPDSTGNLHYNCPFCLKKRGKADTDGKLYVKVKSVGNGDYKKLGKFHCFKCNSRGKLSSNNNYGSNVQVYDKLIRLYNNQDIDEDDSDDNMFYVPNISIPENSIAEKYLFERGISRSMIDFYNMRLGVGNLFGRIVIPNNLFGEEGIWTDMYSARSYLNDIKPKYKNPRDAEKHNCVFNINNLVEGGVCYVVEGAITAICAGKEACATYGCSPSDVQIRMIVEKKLSEIYCVYDNDEAGLLGNRKLSGMLYEEISNNMLRTKLFMVLMPEGIDAADMGEEAFKEYVDKNKVPYYPRSVYNKLFTMFK